MAFRRVASKANVASLLVAIALLAPRSSLAQSASDRETARALMQEGDQRRDKKDFRGALERYQAADALVHVTTTGLEVGRTQIELGLLVEAREKLLEVARVPAKPGDAAVLAQARATALLLSDSLEPRIPGLRVAVRGAPDTANLAVSVDGVAIPTAALIAYRKLNPGHHSIVARYGAAERKDDVTLKESENRELTLDFSSEPPAAIGAAVPSSPPVSATTATPEPAGGSRGPWKTLEFVGFGVGGAGIIAGSITGVLAFTHASAAKNIPASQGGCVNDQCGPATHSDIDASKLDGTLSTVSFIVAGAGVALGVTSLLLGRTTPKDSEPRAGWNLWLGPAAGGVAGTF
jgi:hypothetical protein